MAGPSEFSINGVDCSAEIQEFAELIGIDRWVGERYSPLLIVQLYCRSILRGDLHYGMVMDEIRHLEGCGRPTGTKSEAPLRGKLLHGLWHKHHRESNIRSMAINLQTALHHYGLPSLEAAVKEAQESGEERYFNQEDIRLIAHESVHTNFSRRAADGRLSGEWIIYAKHEGANYYLCLGKHNSGDEYLRGLIDDVCVPQFPFLTSILPPLSA